MVLERLLFMERYICLVLKFVVSGRNAGRMCNIIYTN